MNVGDEAELEAYWNNPGLLLDRIDEELDGQPVDDLPLWSLSDEDEPYRGTEDGRPVHRILDRVLATKRDLLKEWACVRFGYCEAKVRHGETIALGKAVLDGMASVWIQIPLPAATVVCYCVQSLFLDRLCECTSQGV